MVMAGRVLREHQAGAAPVRGRSSVPRPRSQAIAATGSAHGDGGDHGARRYRGFARPGRLEFERFDGVPGPVGVARDSVASTSSEPFSGLPGGCAARAARRPRRRGLGASKGHARRGHRAGRQRSPPLTGTGGDPRRSELSAAAETMTGRRGWHDGDGVG